MARTIHLSRLMRISWDIQRTKNKTRSKSLQAAWVIFANEDITISYLTRKLNQNKPLTKRAEGQFSLFANQ
jgi:type II secretory pathway component PulK